MTTTTTIRTGQSVVRANPVRSATNMERTRTKAIGFSAFLVMLMLTIAITFTAINLNTGPRTPGEDEQDPPVGGGTINFGLPLAGDFAILKGFSDSQLQLNATHGRWQAHRAISIAAPAGTEVLAAYDGRVTAIHSNTLYGTTVEITHANGKVTVYRSLESNVAVSLDRPEVRKGDVIGRVGTTSRVEFTTTPHVRLEMRDANGTRVNPAYFIDFGDK